MMALKRIFLLTLLLQANATALASGCSDNDDYTFGSYRDRYSGRTVTRTCRWIDLNPNQVNNRRARWCNEDVNGSIVRAECPVACDSCTESPSTSPTESPSTAPTESPTEGAQNDPCADDPSYDFGSYRDTNTGKIVTRTCDWIVRNSKRVNQRRANFCGKYFNGSLVRAACPTACDSCTQSPSASPSVSSSVSPTDGSQSDPCVDDPSYSFGSYEWNGVETVRTCSWITINPNEEEKRKTRWCGKLVNDVVVGQKCPEACGECQSDACLDDPLDWVDRAGDGCDWYALGTRCSVYGHQEIYRNDGKIANEACCTCGGGCYNNPSGWQDKNYNNCDFYAANTWLCDNAEAFAKDGVSALDACCVCGGGSSFLFNTDASKFSLGGEIVEKE